MAVYRYPLRSIYRQQVALRKLSGSLIAAVDWMGCTFGWSGDGQTLYLGNRLLDGGGALSRCAGDSGPAAKCPAVGCRNLRWASKKTKTVLGEASHARTASW